jgi:CubicO group peptidase (beta-lactamase class C family)
MRKLTLPIIALLCVLPSHLMGQVVEKEYKPLLKSAKKSNSDALVVIKDGEKVVEYYSDNKTQKVQTMSVTKSVVGLAMAKLFSDGVIDSIDVPVAEYFPEWQQGQKKNITIKHLMNHTSGLQNVASANVEINPAPDVLQLGLCASVVDTPGTEFSYNNKAVNILSGIIKKASGKPIDEYLKSTIFTPMEINDFTWGTDEKGNHYVMAGLGIHGDDLAKLGQLLLQDGSWNGQQLIDKTWTDRLLQQGSSLNFRSALLWWRIPKEKKYFISDKHIKNMQESGLDQSMLSKVKDIKGEYDSQGQLLKAFKSKFDSKQETFEFRQATIEKGIKPYGRKLSGPIVGYKATGDGGQYLVLYPKQNIVAVRLVDTGDNYNRKTDNFANFPNMVYKVAQKAGR